MMMPQRQASVIYLEPCKGIAFVAGHSKEAMFSVAVLNHTS